MHPQGRNPQQTLTRRRGRQKDFVRRSDGGGARRYGFFSFHDLRQRTPQKVEKS
jgi:hypothetical protein